MIRHTRPGFVDYRRGEAPAWTILPAFLLLASSSLAADLKPPKPDPAKPVNYIKWINETLGAEIKENAADMYQRAFDKLTEFDEQNDDSLEEPWLANQKVMVWVSANREAVGLFRQAALMRDCYFPIEDERSNTGDPRLDHMFSPRSLIPNFHQHRTLTRALLAEGCAAWKRGDEASLLNNVMLALRSAHHLDNTSIVTQRCVATNIARTAQATLREAMQQSANPAAIAARILIEFRAVDRIRPSLQQVLLSDRLRTWDYAQRLFLPGNKLGTWLVYGPLMADLTAPLPADYKDLIDEKEYNRTRLAMMRMPQIGFNATLRQIDEYYDELEQWYAKPYVLVAREADQIDAKPSSENANPLLRLLAPPRTRVRILDEYATGSRRATLLICHILIHHGKTDNYPASLDELKATDLKEIRIDPFSGRDFVYKRQPTGFLLYSVSENLKDDGGKHDEWLTDGDFVFWPVQAKAQTTSTRHAS